MLTLSTMLNMQIDANSRYYYSVLRPHAAYRSSRPRRLGETIRRVWLPGRDTVVRHPRLPGSSPWSVHGSPDSLLLTTLPIPSSL